MRMNLSAAIFCASALPALAADGAYLDIIGYSPDSRYFAFEQYGVQDGSGFPYADIFIVDLVSNTWVKGTPIRERLEDEGARIATAHKAAMARAVPLLKLLAIGEPAAILASNPSGEVVAERSRITFDRWYRSSGPSSPDNHERPEVRYELMIGTVELPQAEGCPDDMGKTVGLVVSLKRVLTGEVKEIHRDTSLPKSRGCATGYDIDTVVAHAGFPSPDRMVAIIGTYSFGFEGYDRRFIAIPFVLD